MVLTVLGSGTSHGVPVIGCDCAVCASGDPRDSRYRSALLARGAAGENVLVDAGPEFRLQALRAKIVRLDALLLTHSHADHLHGLDDVRPLCARSPLSIYANAPTLDELRERFAYVFRETQKGGGKPNLELRTAAEPFGVGGLRITPVPIKHGRLDILGWRFDEGQVSAAHVTDASAVPESSIPLLRGLDVLILGALRERTHETHFSYGEALDLIAELTPKRAWFTHLSHDRPHDGIDEYIRNRGFELGTDYRTAAAWDGMEIALRGDGAAERG